MKSGTQRATFCEIFKIQKQDPSIRPMLFNSLAFLLFFPIVCILYYCIPSSQIRARNMLLLVASYYFYMNWHPAYALLHLCHRPQIAIERSNEFPKLNERNKQVMLLDISICYMSGN